MRRWLFLSLLAASLGIAPAPQVSAQETNNVIVGLAALALLGAFLSYRARAAEDAETADDKDRDSRARRRQAAPPSYTAPRWQVPRRGGTLGRAVPDRCALPGRGGAGLYSEACLRQAGLVTERLPSSCRVRLDRGAGSRTAIRGSCLRRAGVL